MVQRVLDSGFIGFEVRGLRVGGFRFESLG